MDAAELDASLVLAVQAALRAGRRILTVYLREFSVDLKEDLSPITEADRFAHDVILEHLGAASPHPILSEEGESIPFEHRRHWQSYWLVDPLDGTKEFVKRNGEFTVNIALLTPEGPQLGVVYAPVPEILYFAHRSIGAYKLLEPAARVAGLDPPRGCAGSGGKAGAAGSAETARALREAAQALARGAPLELDERHRRPRLVVMASRSHRGPAFERYLQDLRRYADRIEVRSLGSALKPCVVAEGAADIYPRFGRTMEWDTAAAHAVVRGAGKRMVEIETERELSYNKPELANPSFVVL